MIEKPTIQEGIVDPEELHKELLAALNVIGDNFPLVRKILESHLPPNQEAEDQEVLKRMERIVQVSADKEWVEKMEPSTRERIYQEAVALEKALVLGSLMYKQQGKASDYGFLNFRGSGIIIGQSFDNALARAKQQHPELKGMTGAADGEAIFIYPEDKKDGQEKGMIFVTIQLPSPFRDASGRLSDLYFFLELARNSTFLATLRDVSERERNLWWSVVLRSALIAVDPRMEQVLGSNVRLDLSKASVLDFTTGSAIRKNPDGTKAQAVNFVWQYTTRGINLFERQPMGDRFDNYAF